MLTMLCCTRGQSVLSSHVPDSSVLNMFTCLPCQVETSYNQENFTTVLLAFQSMRVEHTLYTVKPQVAVPLPLPPTGFASLLPNQPAHLVERVDNIEDLKVSYKIKCTVCGNCMLVRKVCHLQ